MKKVRKLKVEYEFIAGEGDQQRINEAFKMLLEKVAKDSHRDQVLYPLEMD